jgi:hypothetical protein
LLLKFIVTLEPALTVRVLWSKAILWVIGSIVTLGPEIDVVVVVEVGAEVVAGVEEQAARISKTTPIITRIVNLLTR